MEMDAQLFAELRRVIPCTGCALYFPTEAPARQPELLAGERRLLLPLWRGETPLAVAMLHGVRVRETRQALPLLPAVADICLDLLERTRGERTDAVTGLATENLLYARMEEEAARVREQLADPTAEDSHGASLHRLCMGLVLVRMSNGRELAETYGYAFTDGLLRQVADALREDLPGNVVAARVGRFGMAVLMPSSSGRKACQRLAQEALRRMAAVEQRCGVTRKIVRPRLCAGHAVYPQDMEGPEFALSMYEQARRFMERARLAAGDKTVILSFGGSLGARRINEVVADLVAWEQKTHPHAILHLHATGSRGVELFRQLGQQKGFAPGQDLVVSEYIRNMPQLLAAADLVISRAGALTLAELQAAGRASILIPSPNVAENHQYYNALELQRAGAALVIEEKNLTGEGLIQAVESLLAEPGRLEVMGKMARAMAEPESLNKITARLLRLVDEGK